MPRSRPFAPIRAYCGQRSSGHEVGRVSLRHVMRARTNGHKIQRIWHTGCVPPLRLRLCALL